MTAPKFTPDFRPYKRSAEAVGKIIQEADDLALDEIDVASLQTAIHAMQLVPGLYETLQTVLDCMTSGAIKSPLVMHRDKPPESLYYVIERELAKARGEG